LLPCYPLLTIGLTVIWILDISERETLVLSMAKEAGLQECLNSPIGGVVQGGLRIKVS
jgi:hypothetical protein